MTIITDSTNGSEPSTPQPVISESDQHVDWAELARTNQNSSSFLTALREFLLHRKVPDGCSIPHRVLNDASKFHTVEDGILYRCVRSTSEGQPLHQVVLDPKVDDEAMINRLIDHYHNTTTHLGAEAIARTIKMEY
ncbi:hypothetical protein Pmar_PMAR023155 [Perkinsus marinus ATCC 50983]|nr:hypothetical protein Pmar_PMAR023155 [Perkinsus marinus ATCC 50983]EER17003.1 hypothetical protein Pmar_PMAR023155 [Perkinsus marinus ATCC 50983]|eukprot:XP_002785207.1 hypothetical protein Pmar_PMAR023155 [Perkinsus marinus ATCC 50983]